MRHLDEDLLTVDVGDHLGEEFGVEANLHGLALVLAGQFLVCIVGELQVLGSHDQFVLLDGETHLVRCLVGEETDAAECVEERIAVDCKAVGVVLGDGGIVVGVAAFDEAADDVEVLEGEESIRVVVFHAYLQFLFVGGDDVLHHHDGFAGKDERDGVVALDVVAAIAHQLVGVGGHEGDVFGVDFAQDTAHLLAHLVVGGGEGGLADGVGQQAAGQGDAGGVVRLGHGGEGFGVFTRQTVASFAGGDADTIVGVVDAEGQRHVVEAFQDINQQFRGDCDVGQAVDGTGFHLHFRDQGGLQVGGTDGEKTFVQVKVEAIDDGYGVIIGQHTAKRLNLLGEEQAVDDEFHNFTLIIYLLWPLAESICKDNTYFPHNGKTQ